MGCEESVCARDSNYGVQPAYDAQKLAVISNLAYWRLLLGSCTMPSEVLFSDSVHS